MEQKNSVNPVSRSQPVDNSKVENLNKFISMWKKHESPQPIPKYAPEKDSPARMSVLIEMIKLDMEFRFQVFNFPKKLEEYLTEFHEIVDVGIPADLIFEEYRQQKLSGLRVYPEDYYEKYPKQRQQLEYLINFSDPDQTVKLTPMDQPVVRSGVQIDDFNLIEEIGRGGFARVFLARQISMHRLVALKISKSIDYESKALAQLDHSNIVRVYDKRRLSDYEFDMVYMEYLCGGTLQRSIEKAKCLPFAERSGKILCETVECSRTEHQHDNRPEGFSASASCSDSDWNDTVAWLGAQIARALFYAHSRGVLHRDIKPANILMTNDGIPKIADFNTSICEALHLGLEIDTFGGSLTYMSPEQLQACHANMSVTPKDLDARSDIYSLGLVLWELLLGYRPFPSENNTKDVSAQIDELLRHRHRGIRSKINHPSQVNRQLLSILEKCLAPNRDDRWSTGEQLAEQLELCRKPRALKILNPNMQNKKCSRFKLAALGLLASAICIPNAVAGWFNYQYNHSEIVVHLPEIYQTIFRDTQWVINTIAYPIGMSIFLVLACSGLGVNTNFHPNFFKSRSNVDHNRVHHCCLSLGHIATLVVISLWILAGLAYPMTLHLTSGSIALGNYPHFFLSLLFCGSIAAVYPYFVINTFAIRVLYPHQLKGRVSLLSRESLAKLKRQSSIYLLIAALTPMIGIFALVLMESTAYFALTVISAVGVCGFIIIYILFRQLQYDIEALLDAAGAQFIPNR